MDSLLFWRQRVSLPFDLWPHHSDIEISLCRYRPANKNNYSNLYLVLNQVPDRSEMIWGQDHESGCDTSLSEQLHNVVTEATGWLKLSLSVRHVSVGLNPNTFMYLQAEMLIELRLYFIVGPVSTCCHRLFRSSTMEAGVKNLHHSMFLNTFSDIFHQENSITKSDWGMFCCDPELSVVQQIPEEQEEQQSCRLWSATWRPIPAARSSACTEPLYHQQVAK